MARHGGHASDYRNGCAGNSNVFYVPIHIGALIADYGGCLLCGPRWRSSIELIRGALGLIRRRQNSARQLICRISNFRLARGVPQAIQALQAISKVTAGGVQFDDWD